MRSVTRVRIRCVEFEIEEEREEPTPAHQSSELARVVALAARLEPGPVRPRALHAATRLRRLAAGGAR